MEEVQAVPGAGTIGEIGAALLQELEDGNCVREISGWKTLSFQQAV